jgi:uncharacterized protein
MIAYVDASVVLRLALGQPGTLREWNSIEEAVTSALTEVECLRTLDRVRLMEPLPDEDLVERRAAVYAFLESATVVDLARPVLERAAQPLPTSLGTLDAIHLATAQLWTERMGEKLVMATHDSALAMAARALGMRAIGVS